jgi:hypothetical protein
MNIKQFGILAAALVALILVLSTGSALKANQHETKMNKTEIELVNPVHVGDVVLPAGKYVFMHQVSGGQHMATFVSAAGTVSKTTTEVKCTNEPLEQEVAQTSVTVEKIGGVDRITRIEVAGEKVAHVFEHPAA